VENRLLYGLKLEEEDELLNGTGSGGTLNGLINNATPFAGGSTKLSGLDALALGVAQLVASEYEPSGFILNAQDWYSSRLLIADRDDAVVRIAEQHADFFVRNMVVILVEERLAIVIQLGPAMACGSQTNPG
jgi:hypothetical protein